MSTIQVTRWLLPIWGMAALFAVEDNTGSHESLAFLASRNPSVGTFYARQLPNFQVNRLEIIEVYLL